MIQELIKLIFKFFRALYYSIFERNKKKLILNEIETHEELQKKYNLYAENRPKIELNKKNVPEDLHDLIPLAEKWGIGDDIIRNDFQEKSSDKEKQELKTSLNGRITRINDWLDSFDNDKEMSDEAAVFLYMMSGLDEMRLVIEE